MTPAEREQWIEAMARINARMCDDEALFEPGADHPSDAESRGWYLDDAETMLDALTPLLDERDARIWLEGAKAQVKAYLMHIDVVPNPYRREGEA